jgi:RNA polymerase sigma-32 factor
LADEPPKLEDLARELNVSIEYIRLIQMRAFEKVKKATKKRVADAIVSRSAAIQRPLFTGN